jgi:hypothetical protein
MRHVRHDLHGRVGERGQGRLQRAKSLRMMVIMRVEGETIISPRRFGGQLEC